MTADVTNVADADGLTNAAYSYQWLSGDSELTGETGSSYTLASTDFGQAVAVRVTFTDDAGNQETLTSEGIYPIMTARENTPAAGLPTISGAPQVGQTLTASTAGITDADGLDDVSYAYSWSADTVAIEDATAASLRLTSSEQGKAITVTVTFTDDAGNDESLTSGATAAVEPAGPTEPPPAPENLTHTVNDDGHVVLNWTAPGDEHITGYRIMRRMPRQNQDTLLVYVPDTGSTATTYTDNDVESGELYVYRVKAINAAGVGPRSNFVNAEP